MTLQFPCSYGNNHCSSLQEQIPHTQITVEIEFQGSVSQDHVPCIQEMKLESKRTVRILQD